MHNPLFKKKAINHEYYRPEKWNKQTPKQGDRVTIDGKSGKIQAVYNTSEEDDPTDVWHYAVRFDDGTVAGYTQEQIEQATATHVPEFSDEDKKWLKDFRISGGLRKNVHAAYMNGYADHATAYLRQYGNTSRHAEEWADKNGLKSDHFKEAIHTMSRYARVKRRLAAVPMYTRSNVCPKCGQPITEGEIVNSAFHGPETHVVCPIPKKSNADLFSNALRKEDFTAEVTSSGYMIYYKGQGLGGAAGGGKARGRAAQAQMREYSEIAHNDIQQILEGHAPKKYQDIIDRIDTIKVASHVSLPPSNFAVPMESAAHVAHQLAISGMMNFEAETNEAAEETYFIFNSDADMEVAHEIVRSAFKRQIESGKGLWADWKQLEPVDRPRSPQSLMSSKRAENKWLVWDDHMDSEDAENTKKWREERTPDHEFRIVPSSINKGRFVVEGRKKENPISTGFPQKPH